MENKGIIQTEIEKSKRYEFGKTVYMIKNYFSGTVKFEDLIRNLILKEINNL